MTLRFLTSGESHGRGFLVTVEGLPSGMPLGRSLLEEELARRRRGFGRGPRMKLERDLLTIWGGVRDGVTTGAPLGISLENSEWDKWRPALDPEGVSPEAAASRASSCPRPGHADLPGALKYGHGDLRNVIERASARLTAAWTLAGTAARILLAEVGVEVGGSVVSIGEECLDPPAGEDEWKYSRSSDLGCPRSGDESRIAGGIRKAAEAGDTLGGTFLLRLKGLPAGVGSYVEWDRRLDGRLAAAIMSIPGIKGVEVGEGFRLAGLPGSRVHDEIFPGRCGPVRMSNRAGGLEGGMTNGEDVILRAAMKPIPTLRRPLRSVDLLTGQEREAHAERSDVCAVPAACVVGEAMAAWVAASALAEQFGGDVMADLAQRVEDYRNRMGRTFHGEPER